MNYQLRGRCGVGYEIAVFRSVLIRLSAVMLVLFGFSACSSGLSKFDRRLDKLEESLSDLRRFQAEQTSDVSALQKRLREMSGRLEQVEYSGSSLQNSRGLRSRAPSNTGRTTQVSPVVRDSAPLPSLVPRAEYQTDIDLLNQLPPTVSRPFGDALSKIQTGAYRAALPDLRKAIDYNYQDTMVPNFLFWVGFCHQQIKQYTDALAAFHDVVSRYPKHERAPMALLYQADVFVLLKDKGTARVTLKKLLVDYPRTRAASRAKSRLKGL